MRTAEHRPGAVHDGGGLTLLDLREPPWEPHVGVAGDLPMREYLSEDGTRGRPVVLREGFVRDGQPGSVHGIDPHLASRAGFTMLEWRSGPSTFLWADGADQETTMFEASAQASDALLAPAGSPPWAVVLTATGSVDPEHRAIEAGALVVTTDEGAARLDGRLPLVAEAHLLPDAAAEARLLGVRRDRSHLFLRYELRPR